MFTRDAAYSYDDSAATDDDDDDDDDDGAFNLQSGFLWLAHATILATLKQRTACDFNQPLLRSAIRVGMRCTWRVEVEGFVKNNHN